MDETFYCIRNKANNKPVAIGLLGNKLIISNDCPLQACNIWSEKEDCEWVLSFLNKSNECSDLQVSKLTKKECLEIPSIRDRHYLLEAIGAFKNLGIQGVVI